ncbi:MAG TPA: transglycosylase [Desulfobulbus sp.]|nr:transglycosylase [Desulfobulbus sp.]
MGIKRFFLLLCCAAVLVLSGCGKTPLLPVAPTKYPVFADDLEYADLDRAIEQSLIYLRKRPGSSRITIAGRSYPVDHLIRSLLFFRNLVADHPSPGLLNQQISTCFDIYQASGTDGYNPQRKMLVTGYYQPVFEGSLTAGGAYRYPIYGIPETLVLRHTPGSGRKQIGRLEGGRFLDYWTRAEIENDGRAAGNELVYLKDPLDAFLLHVQGSGLIKLPDGSIRGIHYAMKNGRKYKSIGKYMVETGRMTLAEASIDSIRSYLAAHPQEIPEILHHNDSFIFFKWTTTHGAIGSLGRELTAGRSIAMDQSRFPAGALSFLSSRKPILDNGHIAGWTSFGRFVLVQDTGSAIRGSGRVDLFWGTGKEAGLAAGRMKEDGTLYFLLLKEQFLQPTLVKYDNPLI